ncbi:hypothetical protein [Streptomyces sp. NPDC059759]|uniref:hypothetical protein n=1 Tax=Streptomyces sp. NPDC059759 TaxID=3346936 RepID=UPI003646D03D
MTDVIAGQPATLLSQWYPYDGGPLTDLDATPTISIAAVATGAVALAPTTSGVTHPGTGSYGYAWTPAAGLTPGLYLATWSGLKSGSPVSAVETLTVYAPPTAPDAISAAGVWYATREEVKAELDVRETSRSNQRIDRALADATEAVYGLTHRRFYPVLTTRRMDWPSRQGSTSWVLRLDSNEIISMVQLTSGATAIPAGQYLLRRADDRDEPPYSRVELSLDSSASFGQGSTYQQDVALYALFGYRNDETPAGVTAEALDTTETGIDVDAVASAAAGVGSLLRIDAERVIVTGRSMLDTGQTLAGDLTNQNNAVVVAVPSGAAFAVGEMILIDGERMLVDEIAGNNLLVRRAWDGSPIAPHTTGAKVYAPRSLTVQRGALGTTAAPHTTGAAVARWEAPGGVRQLCLAEALVDLMQGRSAYARTAGSGESEREASGKGLEDLRARVYTTYGRKARSAAV